MSERHTPDLKQILKARYSDGVTLDANTPDAGQSTLLQAMAGRGSCRQFQADPVPLDLLHTLCAVALAAPTKSDLQQRDIILLQSADVRQQLSQLVGGQSWVANAPMIIVFCGNNRRQRLLHEWCGVPFANDHLDAFFNATADAAIALGAFVTAAEAAGLGCCPISAVRNDAPAVSELLNLPAHVFPVAGLAVGYPKTTPQITKRLPLKVTCHVDAYCEHNLQEAIADYDLDRTKAEPYDKQRFVEKFGTSPNYGWSEDKVRQYSQPERANFGTYVRGQGFCLD
jgi:FMN reductase [NAD(P)H]